MEANDLSSLISSITQNPEMLKKMMGALSSLSGENEAEKDSQTASIESVPALTIPKDKGHTSDRKRLLLALKPYLSKERQSKAEMLINVMSLLDSGIIDMLGR